MSNTIDTTRPSYLGIPDCINETVSISNDLVQCVGTDARWQSAVRRSMTGEVAGECYKTDTALPKTVNMIKHGQLMQAMLTAEEVTADRVGRAVTQYRYRLQQGVPYLPQRDKLVCLYVPRWQEDRTRDASMQDLSAHGRHLYLHEGHVDYNDDGSATVSKLGNMTYYGNVGAINNYTIIANRLSFWRTGGNLYNHYNGFKTRQGSTTVTVLEISRPTNLVHCYSNRQYKSVQYNDAEAWIYQRRGDYCGQTLPYNDQSYDIDRLVLGGGFGSSGNLWRYMWCVAMWSVSLTDMEIQVAQMYLAQQSRPTDL